ncbi:MAG: hypothetical protein JXB04_07120 [Kiritimatiellae bacterium]|nr:hypothetical protein [Kiritimatiellia bacterium]
MTLPTIDSPQTCRLCGGRFTVRALLDRITHFWPEVDVVVSDSPCCHTAEELRIEDRKVERGYVYAAGAPHFCGMEVYDAPTLELKEKQDTLVFVLDGKERTVAQGSQRERGALEG